VRQPSLLYSSSGHDRIALPVEVTAYAHHAHRLITGIGMT